VKLLSLVGERGGASLTPIGWAVAGLVALGLILGLTSCAAVTDPPSPGGGAEALIAVIELLEVEEEPPRRNYSRDNFEHWVDLDGVGCNTRHRVLAAQATALKARSDSADCKVVEGEWELLFHGGRHIGAASEIDVDHVVALAEAWDSGAAEWNAARRRVFANDPLNLIVASRQVNQEKADRDAGEWTPPDPRARCLTAAKMTLTKLRYRLRIDAVERRGLIRMARHCDREDQRSIGGFPLPGTVGFTTVRDEVLAELRGVAGSR
jgi:hypothetical protein